MKYKITQSLNSEKFNFQNLEEDTKILKEVSKNLLIHKEKYFVIAENLS